MTLTWPGSCEWLMAGSCPRSPRAAGLVVVLVVELVALRAAQFVPVADGHLVRLAEPDASRQHLELAAPARHAREQHVFAEVVGLLKVLHCARRRLAERQRRDDARQVRQLLAVSQQYLQAH